MRSLCFSVASPCLLFPVGVEGSKKFEDWGGENFRAGELLLIGGQYPIACHVNKGINSEKLLLNVR